MNNLLLLEKEGVIATSARNFIYRYALREMSLLKVSLSTLASSFGSFQRK